MWLHRAAVGHFLKDGPARECFFSDARLASPGEDLLNGQGSGPSQNSGLGLLATSSRRGFSAGVSCAGASFAHTILNVPLNIRRYP